MHLKVQMMFSILFLVLHGKGTYPMPQICIPHQIENIKKGLLLYSSEWQSISFYTPFQCMDYCFRDYECTGFTFFMNYSLSSSIKKECRLFSSITGAQSFTDDRKELYFSYREGNESITASASVTSRSQIHMHSTNNILRIIKKVLRFIVQ